MLLLAWKLRKLLSKHKDQKIYLVTFLKFSLCESSCWTAKVLDEFQGRCDVFVQAVRQSVPISIQEFTDDLKHRLRGVWRDVEGVDLQ